MMDAIRFINLLWRALVPWFELGLDCALAFAPAADDVDFCAVMLRFNCVQRSSQVVRGSQPNERIVNAQPTRTLPWPLLSTQVSECSETLKGCVLRVGKFVFDVFDVAGDLVFGILLGLLLCCCLLVL
jgi:hypothetical protein